MRRPILKMLIGYLLGILYGLYFKRSIAFFFGVIIFMSLLFYRKRKKQKKRYLINIKRYGWLLITKKEGLMVLVIALLANTIVLLQKEQYDICFSQTGRIQAQAVILSEEKITNYTVTYTAKVKQKGKEQKMYLILSNKVRLKIGEEISFLGEYQPPKAKRNEGGFEETTYLKSIGIRGKIKVSSFHSLGHNKLPFWLQQVFPIRDVIQDLVYNTILDSTNQNLFLKMVLGKNTQIDSSLKKEFQKSSVSHMLAISGMHISCLLIGISFLFKILKVPKRGRDLGIIVFIIFFCYLVDRRAFCKKSLYHVYFTSRSFISKQEERYYHELKHSSFVSTYPKSILYFR